MERSVPPVLGPPLTIHTSWCRVSLASCGQEGVATPHDSPIVVEASIDTSGRVYDYTIVEGPQDATTEKQVINQLLNSVFQPASAFGVPIRGRVVLTYSGVLVRG